MSDSSQPSGHRVEQITITSVVVKPTPSTAYNRVSNFLLTVGMHPDTSLDQFNDSSNYLVRNSDIFYELKDVADKDKSQRAKDFFKTNLPFADGFDWKSALYPATGHGDISTATSQLIFKLKLRKFEIAIFLVLN